MCPRLVKGVSLRYFTYDALIKLLIACLLSLLACLLACLLDYKRSIVYYLTKLFCLLDMRPSLRVAFIANAHSKMGQGVY